VQARSISEDKQFDLELKISDLKSIKEGRTASNTAHEIILSNLQLSLLNTQLISMNNKSIDLEIKKLEIKNNYTQLVELTSPPTNPVLIGPKRNLNIVIAAVSGLFIGVFAAFFRNYVEGYASK